MRIGSQLVEQKGQRGGDGFVASDNEYKNLCDQIVVYPICKCSLLKEVFEKVPLVIGRNRRNLFYKLFFTICEFENSESMQSLDVN